MKRPGRPTPPIILTGAQRKQPQATAGSRSLSRGRVVRAKIVLMAAEGITNTDIAPQVGLSIRMTGIWRRRFFAQGAQGLRDEPGPGHPPDCGQSGNPQEPDSQGLARQKDSVSCSLKPTVCLVAEPSGHAIWHYRTQRYPAKNAPQRQGPSLQDGAVRQGI